MFKMSEEYVSIVRIVVLQVIQGSKENVNNSRQDF